VTPEQPRGWVRTSRDGAVLTVTLDRPDRLNAQTPDTWAALADVGRSLDDDMRIVVVRGEGRAFSAGLDRSLFTAEPGTTGALADVAGMPTDQAEARIAEFQAGFRWLRSPGIVSIAAVQGHAIGAGAQLALACDLRILTEDAALSLPEVTLGLVPDLTGTSNLVELVGYSRALEICATSRWVEAAEAKELGLANIVVPADELEATVKDLSDALLGPLPGAIRETKALLLGAADRAYDDQLRAEREAQERRLKELLAALG
jgi:enoyl-CoA hydratase/carnithine racemase